MQQTLDSFYVLLGCLDALVVRPDHSLKHDLNLHVGVVGEFVLAERL